ncbi:transcriptional regulator, LacI family [Pseudopedobacter saltans DSM 12145]|uniref:Transcriptional regulator, LacI family n=1 Tax=Pseudopedobacter saltans (strain ATCC 51119 / DSM 12145 / JCM 21818 / CCUG 39354 / LMG 10337 / NBRC 100064 / NCIMB 13643) TaxID=762903 RepID=F0S896_PSESL|nr:substrate-binding domain-containing protein [Pseudopedobacter saltans]ADY52358.1 transcriptional regulator, LacI family [Pseudopedobacter saltans DSM 12145]
MAKKVVRIKDIALKSGVSTGTVDRVLHNRGRVSEDAKKKVLAVIDELNYEPNLIARALGNNKIFTIAALIPDGKLDTYWEAPASGIKHAEKELRGYGIAVEQFLFDPYNVESFIKQAKQITADNFEGILVSPIFYKEVLPFLEYWRENDIPFIFFNTQIADFGPLSYIGQDSFQSGLVAAKLISNSISNGYIVIAHIDESTKNAAHLLEKENGFNSFFKNKKEFQTITAELNNSTEKDFFGQLDKLFQNNKDIKAIYVTTSKAYHIANYLQKKKLKDIKLVGYDLLDKNIEYLENGLIKYLINQNPYGQGYLGISYLTDYLVFKKKVPGIKHLPLDIIIAENAKYYINKY